MDLPTALLRDLLDLCVGMEGDGEVGARLTALVAALRAAVPSYGGLHLTVFEDRQPVSLSSFLPTVQGRITTSLRLPFLALSSGFDPRDRMVFYATAQGAFVDLAADLSYALHTPTTYAELTPDRSAVVDGDGRTGDGHQDDCDRGRVIVLDADLPPDTLVTQLSGLEDVSAINRAVGMLIDAGHHPDDAHATLRRRAAAAGVAPHIYAASMLRR
ncbi:MAG TPA: hypothetical protein VFU98_15320 [Microlunatus sp.]|nr:hypothetical protein [Microlunatus sp.]